MRKSLPRVAAVAATIVFAPGVGSQGPDTGDTYLSAHIVGITPGQMLRTCVAQVVRQARPSAALRLELSNSTGQVLAAGDATIPLAGFACLDSRFEQLNTEGEPGTNRVQLRVSAYLMLPRNLTPDDFVVGVEIVDQATGNNQMEQHLLGWAYLPSGVLGTR